MLLAKTEIKMVLMTQQILEFSMVRKSVHGKINLPMTAFYYFARGDANLTDPTQGDPRGAIQFYNFFQGRIGKTGAFFRTPSACSNNLCLKR
ncbi:MAG: hypothetical protein MZV64_44105 [Ignavibacteriales bacterium]|nr:hypothetical protein [Ignavibacteriales bacterium]